MANATEVKEETNEVDASGRDSKQEEVQGDSKVTGVKRSRTEDVKAESVPVLTTTIVKESNAVLPADDGGDQISVAKRQRLSSQTDSAAQANGIHESNGVLKSEGPDVGGGSEVGSKNKESLKRGRWDKYEHVRLSIDVASITVPHATYTNTHIRPSSHQRAGTLC